MISPVMVKVRPARPADAEGIAAVLTGCWPDDTADPRRISSLIERGGRTTVVAGGGGAIAGFADAFLTEAADGLLRWEIDLLAVAEAARGQGVATALLLEVAVAAPVTAGAARALVRLGNRAAERTFAAAGFVPGAARALMVAPPAPGALPAEKPGFTRVDTLTYSGVWLERWASESTLAEARALAHAEGRERVGVVLAPGGAQAAVSLCAGFTAAGIFRWWSLILAEGLGERRRDVVAYAEHE